MKTGITVGKYYITARPFGVWMGVLKGATMYELQIGRFGLTWCYLWGGHWKLWSRDNRLRVQWYEAENGD
jgi:hypothetical protein